MENVSTTALVAHPTGLAASLDGVHFEWKGDVYEDRINQHPISHYLFFPQLFS